MLAVQGRGVLREGVPDAALEESGRPQGRVQVGKLVLQPSGVGVSLYQLHG